MHKIIITIFLAFVAATATGPYAYRFVAYYIPASFWQIILSWLFAVIAVGANTILGTYSLLKIKLHVTKHTEYIAIISLLSAIPFSSMCFFGYKNLLPLPANITLSAIVMVVNGGIGYTAICNLIDETLLPAFSYSYSRLSISLSEFSLRSLGFIVGLLVSIVPYLSAAAGITDILKYYHFSTLLDWNTGFIVAIFAFLPLACLYANSNQSVMKMVYDFLNKVFTIKWIPLFMFIFCIISGSALAQIAREFFSPDQNIPLFFKTALIQSFANTVLVWLAFFSNAGVNYYSMQRLFSRNCSH